MAIYINTDVLKYGGIRLKKWAGSEPPPATNNLLRAVVNYARFIGLPAIPARTVEKIKNDPYYKYVFSRVMYHQDVYRPESWLGKSVRETLERAIKDPAAVTPQDRYDGIINYLSYFTHSMPRGFYRTSMEHLMKRLGLKPETKEYAEEEGRRMQLFGQIDKILEGKGMTGTADHLFAEKSKEGWGQYDKRLEYAKLCLEIFKTLIEKHHYDPEFLIK